MTKKYVVTLAKDEREQLLKMIGSGTAKARTLSRARILLKANDGWQDKEISQALDVSIPTVERVWKRFVFEGFEASLRSRRSKQIYSADIQSQIGW